jgi:hypothetical protein
MAFGPASARATTAPVLYLIGERSRAMAARVTSAALFAL